MFKNVASQTIQLFAFTVATGLAKTGDSANITASVAKDGGAVTDLADTSATEKDATKAAGWYQFDVAQAESNADSLLFTGRSATGGVAVVGMRIDTTPASFTSQVAQTGDNYARIGAAGAGLTALGDTRIANLDAAVSTRASPTNITAGTITTATNLTNAATAGDFTATQKASIGTAVAASAVASVTGNVGGNVTGSVGSVVGAVGSVTGAVGSVTAPVTLTGDLTATMKTSVTTAATAATPTVGSVATVTNPVTLTSAYDAAKTAAQVGDAMTLTSGERDAIATALLKLDWTGITGEAAHSLLNAFRFPLNDWEIDVSNILTVYKEDGTTVAFTRQLVPSALAQPIISSTSL